MLWIFPDYVPRGERGKSDGWTDMLNLPNWAWCIATYNRHDMLERTCALALAQSVPPAEIVITDASENWESGRTRISDIVDAAVANGVPRPRLSYEKASKPSSAVQRNESIQRAQAEIVFLFDDDTLMFPETAEQILEVYARDVNGVVQAVTAAATSELPQVPSWQPAPEAPRPVTAPPEGAAELAQGRARDGLAQLVRGILRADDRFVPYDPEPRVHPVPQSMDGLGLRSWKLAAGYHLTARRASVLREPFDHRLTGYSPGEDSDMTYRLTRHGPILHRPDAMIHHAEAPGSRFGMFRRVALGATNALLMHRVHSSDIAYSARESRALLRRRLLIEFAKDVRGRDWRLPRTRAIVFALRHINEILSTPNDKIDEVFERFQSI